MFIYIYNNVTNMYVFICYVHITIDIHSDNTQIQKETDIKTHLEDT